jgi:hypothetical protein
MWVSVTVVLYFIRDSVIKENVWLSGAPWHSQICVPWEYQFPRDSAAAENGGSLLKCIIQLPFLLHVFIKCSFSVCVRCRHFI